MKNIQRQYLVKKKQFLKWWKTYGTPKNLIIAGVIVICFILIIFAVIFYPRQPESHPPILFQEQASVIRHPLTGEAMSESLSALPQVFGVMIENSADAWPLSGVDDAFLVIEAPVEGNIPRFIAFYSEEQDVNKIGPVRSARSYYLDWNAEFDGIYGHVGGSPQALEDIVDDETLDLNQFFQSEYYYRDEVTRYAPHNVYTRMDSLRDSIFEMREKYSDELPQYDSWQFADGVALSAESSTISLNWSNSLEYSVDWAFDPSTDTYTRKQGRNEYVANNVVIIETEIFTIPGDDKGRKSLQTIGSGAMHCFQNGVEIVGTWKKPSAEDRLRFYNKEGIEIVMNAGKTWVEVVDSLDRLLDE